MAETTIYDQVLGGAPASGGAAPAQNPYDKVLDSQDVELNQQLMRTIAASAGTNPDAAGEAQRLGFETGIGADVALRNMAEVRRRAAIVNAQYRNLAASSPVLAQQLTNPHFADIAHDDLDNLSTTEKVFRWAKSVPSDVENQWQAGQLQHEMGLLGFKVQTRQASDEDWSRINDLKQQLEAIPKQQTFLGGVAQFAGQSREMGVGALTAGAVTGLAAGGATALASDGLAAPAVPLAATEGFKFGAGVFAGADIYKMTSGQSYLDMVDKGVKPVTAQYAAAGVGAINTALMMGGMKLAGAPFAKALNVAIGDRLADAMTRPTVARALQNVAGQWALNSAEGGAAMALQTAVSQVGEDVAKSYDKGQLDTVLATPEGRKEFAGRVVDSFLNGLELTGAIGAAGSLLHLGAETIRAQAAQRAQQFFAGLTDNATGSKVRERNPNAYESFIAAQANGTGAENVYIDGQRMAEVLHQSGLDPERVDETLPGVREQVEEAARTGGDVAIPTAQYAAKLAGTDLGKAMLPHMRLDPDAMSATEAAEFTANQQTILAEAQARATQEMAGNDAFARSARVVESDVFDQLKATKTMPDDVARVNAQFMRDLVVTQAADLGVTPEEFYQKYKPSIERASGDTMPDVSLKQGAGDRSTQPNEGTPAGAIGKIPVLGRSLDEYKENPYALVEELESRNIGDDPGNKQAIGLRGIYKEELGKTPRRSWHSPDGEKKYKLNGTSAVGITGQYFAASVDTLESSIGRAIDLVKKYGDTDYIAVLRGDLDTEYSNDASESVLKKPEVIGYIRRKSANADLDSLPSDTPSAPSSGAGILHQPARGGFDPSRLAVLLNDKADFTTFAHETAHWYLTVIGDLAKQADAPGRFKNDMGTLLNWFGVKDHATWDAMSLEEQRKFHEQFAYSFEKYLAEGKAPSLALQGVFDRFKFWMMRVYTSVKDNVNTLYRKEHGADLPMMSGEVRGVMDRMLASDEQIRHAQTVRGLEPLFTSKEMALKSGMSEGDWEEYRNHVAGARDAASAELGASSLRNMQWLSNAKSRVIKEMQAQHDALRAETRAEVEKEVQGEDLYRAQRWFKTGEMETPDGESVAAEHGYKLNAEDVKAMFAGKPGAPDLTKLRGMMGPDGMHPDLAAPMFGFDNGEQLVRNLADARPLREEVDARTDQRMLERHGDMNSAEELDRRTNEALHNDARARMLATELKFVQRLQQPVRVLQEAARNVAQRILAEKRIGDISEHDYISGEAKAERAAQAAMRRGDDAGVAKAVQDRLVQNALAKEAIRVREAVDQKLKFLSKFDNPSKAITQKIGADYMDRINELLSGYELSRRAALGGDERPLSQWVNDEYSKTGVMPAVSDDLIVDLGTMHWKDMTVAQLGALHDAVVSLDYIGRRRTEVELEGKAVQVDELIQQLKQNMAGVKHTEPVDIRADLAHAKGLDKVQAKFLYFKSRLRSMDAALLKMEQFFQWLDAGKDAGAKEAPVDGPMSRLFRLASNAEGKERAMRAGSMAALRQLGENLRDARIDLNEKLDVPELPLANGKTWMYREQLLAVALNLGNESNREKLFAGYQWSDERVLSAVNRLLSKPEMDFVQGVWDHIGSYGSGIVELQRRQTGVTPEMIKPAAVVTQHGVYPGGYYPVEYDNFADRSIEEKQARRADQLFENNYANPATNKGHTIKRTGYKGPIYLSLDVISKHIDQVSHDLAWREAITDMNKVLTDPRLQREVEETYGREYAKQFRPWLQAMANDRVFNTSGDVGWEKMIRQARTNATVVGIGFRLSTMLVHGTSALSNSIGEVGPVWFAKGVQQFMGMDRIQAARDFVFERSPEMANRMNAVDRNITEAINEINSHEKAFGVENAAVRVYDQARRFSMYGVAMLDMASAMPTWLGAYLKGMAKEADGGLNLSEADAIEYGNRAVRNAHGGGGAKDLAAIQRDKGLASLFTMFYSFWNHMYNRQRDLAKGAGAIATGQSGTSNLPRLLARSLFYFVVPQLAHAMLKPGARKDEEAGDLAGFTKLMAEEIGLGAVSGIPMVRDFFSAAVNGRDYTITPLEQSFKTLLSAGRDVSHLVQGEPTSKRFSQNVAQSAGYVFGIPTAQPAATAKFLWDVVDGDADPQTMKDWWQGVMTGHLR